MSYSAGCLVCGSDLTYTEQPQFLTCSLCGSPVPSNARCQNGHFICDSCHALPALELIQKTCLASTATDPLLLAEALMRNPALNMHGPEHHFLVPAVLIAAYTTLNGGDRAARLAAARSRAEQVQGGFCGLHGTCGAAMGAGIALSVLTGATPLAREEWRLANLMTAACLTAIGEAGGPRCCKRDTYLALLTAREFLNRHLQAGFSEPQTPTCSFSARNRECLERECRFYPC